MPKTSATNRKENTHRPKFTTKMICMDFYKKKKKADNCEIKLKITNKATLCDKTNKIAITRNKATVTEKQRHIYKK